MRHCNGCGNDLDPSLFIGKDSRCKDCRKARVVRHTKRIAEDPEKRRVFDAMLAALSPDPRVRDNVARPGVPRGPGVREARRELYAALRALSWTVQAIAIYAKQCPDSVKRALEGAAK